MDSKTSAATISGEKNNTAMEDFEFVVQYSDQKPLKLNTCHIEEDVLRTRMGLKHHNGEDY